MGYYKANGRYADTIVSTFANGVISVTTTSPAHELGDRGTIRIDTAVTAITGTPTLTVAVETSKDGVTWVAVAAFTAISTVSTARKIFSGLDRFVHIVETVGGGAGTITRSVVGESC
jgi:hypothetical protein